MFDKVKGRIFAGKISDGLLLDNWEEAHDCYEKYGRMLTRKGRGVSGTSFNDCFFQEELDEHTVAMVGLGKHVRGNLRFLLDELNHGEDYAGFHIYVRTSEETDPAVRDLICAQGWERTETVPDTVAYRKILERAKYLITEVYFPKEWVKKPGQVLISLWHGTPVKKLGQAKNAKNSHKSGAQQKNFIEADYLLCPSAYTKEKLLDSYRVSSLMHARLVLLGYPRTGGMLRAAEEEPAGLRERLAPNQEKIYAYMPTFRDTMKTAQEVALYKELLDYLDGHLLEGECLYVNLHHRANASVDYTGYRRVRPFPPDVDTYQLLAVSDALISDYSSVFFDYLALRRQIILYIPDYDSYRKKRGMYLDLKSLPFDLAGAKEEVLTCLHRGKSYDDSEAFARFCGYDSTENAARLCRLLVSDTSGLTLERIPQNSAAKVLIHSERMSAGEQTALLENLARGHDPAAYEIFFSCDAAMDVRQSGAYPMFNEYPVIGSDDDAHLCQQGQKIREMSRQGELSFDKAMRYLRYEYALAGRRIFGDARFSLAVLYDCADADRILTFSSLGSELILCLQEETLDRISEGDPFLREAVLYAAARSRAVFTFTQEACEKAAALFAKEKRVTPALLQDWRTLDETIRKER